MNSVFIVYCTTIDTHHNPSKKMVAVFSNEYNAQKYCELHSGKTVPDGYGYPEPAYYYAEEDVFETVEEFNEETERRFREFWDKEKNLNSYLWKEHQEGRIQKGEIK